ncbi:MAG: DNA-protecting protein DprA [Betaproteobacteria bacterium]|nr:DNA-protecting protein DprA [Betaproteobacteria bacterium]
MSPDEDLAAWIDLSLVPGLGGRHLRALLAAFGLPGEVFATSRARLSAIVPDAVAASLLQRDRKGEVERALAWAAQPGHRVMTLADSDYPKQLFEIADPPPLLYVRGDALLLSAKSLAVVGSRSATPQGVANAEAFARALSNSGFAIVSGLALGIDAAAHRGGLAGEARTIAVIGTGADVIYPKGNAELTEKIAGRGVLISEFPLGTPAHAGNFPRRNRVISGLARGCLVVEAALASGSLITARMAAEQGREVFAIPGSIHSPVAKGCHALIKQGAKLVESARDVLEELGALGAPAAVSERGEEEHALLGHMGYDPCSIDALVERSGLTVETVSAMLLQLELEGKIGGLSGGLYQRIS